MSCEMPCRTGSSSWSCFPSADRSFTGAAPFYLCASDTSTDLLSVLLQVSPPLAHHLPQMGSRRRTSGRYSSGSSTSDGESRQNSGGGPRTIIRLHKLTPGPLE